MLGFHFLVEEHQFSWTSGSKEVLSQPESRTLQESFFHLSSSLQTQQKISLLLEN